MQQIITFLPLLILLTIFPGIHHAEAKTRLCPDSSATVTYQDDIDYLNSCQAIRETLDFMSANGFYSGILVHIDIVENTDNSQYASNFGYYSVPDKKITMLSLRTFLQNNSDKDIFGIPASEALHRSFIAHEVAHAVAHHNFLYDKPPAIAHEYIAYVVQIATLPADLRSTIYKTFSYQGFRNEYEINAIYYGMSPHNFALKSFLHFTNPRNGMRFVTKILQKNILQVCDVFQPC